MTRASHAPRTPGASRAASDLDMHAIYQKLSAMQATLSVVKHTANNSAQEIKGLIHLVGKQNQLSDNLERLVASHGRHDERISSLEVDRHRREGAIGLFEWVARHWPFTLIGGALLGFIAWATGKL